MDGVDEFGQPVGRPVSWTPPAPLTTLTAEGRTVAIAPLTPDHAEDMWRALGPDRAQWTYMPADAPTDVADMRRIIESYTENETFRAHVITDPAGEVLGMASYLRIDPTMGSAEVGAVSYGTRLRRSTAATEAMTLLARHVFDAGYRRYQWKCDALNTASRTAATRLGFRFEGIWRDAVVYKGRNRDTAWYAITADDWTRLAPVHEAWLETATGDGPPAFRLSDATAALWNDEEAS